MSPAAGIVIGIVIGVALTAGIAFGIWKAREHGLTP